MRVAVSSSHVSVAPSSSGEGLLTLFPCSSVGCLPWETVLHEHLQHESFPWAAVLHELLQHGSFPWGAVLQELTAPAWVPYRVTSPASKPAPAWAPLSTGLQILPGDYSSADFPRGHSLLQAHPPALKWVSPRAAGHSLPQYGLYHRRQGNLCSSAWSTSSHSFTDLGVCRVVSLTYSHSSLWLQF